MTKEDVLQKVNEYCTEKAYTNETLTDEFKEKFSDFFAKKYSEDTDIEADGVFDDIKFNLNTAFSATSKGISQKVKVYEDKENDYKKQIAELTKKTSKTNDGKDDDNKRDTLSDELLAKLKKLEQFESEARLNEKFKEVLSLAKKNVREDLHKSLANYAEDFVVNLEETSEAQAKKLTSRFQGIFKDTIGDIKPLAPKQVAKRDEEVLNNLPKIKI